MGSIALSAGRPCTTLWRACHASYLLSPGTQQYAHRLVSLAIQSVHGVQGAYAKDEAKEVKRTVVSLRNQKRLQLTATQI